MPNASYRLVKSPSKSEEFVYGRIADRVNYDLDVIHRAFGQRYIDQSSTRFNEKVGNRLQIADSLAMRALQLIRSKQNQTEMTTSVLTYCQRYLRTRVLPYTRVAPLAIPMSALRYDEDLTAIAHEVGQALGGQGRAVAGVVQAHHHAVAYQLVGAYAFDGGQILDALGPGRDGPQEAGEEQEGEDADHGAAPTGWTETILVCTTPALEWTRIG